MMYESIYKLNSTEVNDTSYHDDYNDLKHYFILNNDSIYMIDGFVMMCEYKFDSNKDSISFDDFCKAKCTDTKQLAITKELAGNHSGNVNESVMKFFASHTIEECMEEFCTIEGHDTILTENEITAIYCFDKNGYNSIFNYGEIGNTKITKIKYKAMLPRVPITDKYDIYK